MAAEGSHPGFDRLAARLGGYLVAVEPLAGGVSASLSSLVVVRAAGGERRVVVRGMSRLASKGDEGAEIAGVAAGGSGGAAALTRMAELLNRLGGRGLPVPEPVLTDGAGELLGEPVLVLEHLPGTTALPASTVALPALAALMTRLHDIDASALAGLDLPPRCDPAREARDLLARIRADAVEVVRDPEPSNGHAVLLHGDFWPGNVLWSDGEVSGLIDWEDAAVGDPEADLATACLELTLALGRAAANTFSHAYERLRGRRIDQHRLDLWSVCASAGMALYVGEWGLEPARESAVRAVALNVLDATLERLRAH